MRPPTYLELAALACALLPGAARAGPWTLGEGTLALKEGVGLWTTDRKFASSLDRQLTFSDGPVEGGDRIPFDPSTGGRLTTVGVETDARLGVFAWLDVGVVIPLLFINFDTDPVDTVDSRFGLGDVRLSVQAMLPAMLPVALASRLEVKLPTGDFDPSVFAAPLTEGQLDFTAWVSSGASLPWHSWASLDFGYRLRFENPDNRAEPGDELLFYTELGTRLVGGLSGKVAFDGLLGRTGSIDRFGTSTPLPRRRVFSSWMGLWWAFSDNLWVEASVRWLFAGEDYPAGFQVFTGVRGTVQLFGGDEG